LDPNTGNINWFNTEYTILDFRSDLILNLPQGSLHVFGIEPITEKVLFQTSPASNNTLAGVLSGPYFALVLNGGSSLAGFSSSGQLLWTKDFSGSQIFALVSCSTQHFCIGTASASAGVAINFIEGPTGNQRWIHPGNSVASQGTNEDYVVIGDGDFMNEHFVYLVEAKTGNMVWNTSLGDGNDGYDWAISPEFVLVSFAHVGASKKRNAYDCAVAGLRLSDGGRVFTATPQGATVGRLTFFKNYDFTFLGDEEVAHYDGHNGKELCAVEHIQAYSMHTQPATYGDSFFVTYFQMAWTPQNVLRLSCN